MANWTNEDGLLVRFAHGGGADAKGQVARDGTALLGDIHTLEVEIPYDNLPATGDVNEDRPNLPAHAIIVDAFLVCNTAWDGTTPTLTIGLADSAGSAIDADGIDAAIDVDSVQASAGDVVACDGALVDKTATIGSDRAWVYAATGGTVTAGKSTLYLTYIVPTV